MSERFDPDRGLVAVEAKLCGPRGERIVRLAVDTGATSTMVNRTALIVVGCDPAVSGDHVQLTTGSGVVRVPRVAVPKFEALGHERSNFPIVAHTLPPSASVDGVLGLDFMRGLCLIVDFRAGRVTLG
jgi:predicted aspartyl protease